MECAFLSELDSTRIYQKLKEKVEQNELLDNEELMEFIILPLSYHTKEEKQRKIRETVELAARIQDRSQQLFTLAGILTFTDKLIDQETASRIRRMIEMTQVAQIFEAEKRQALAQAAQIFEEEKQQTAQIFEEEKRQALKENEQRVIQDTSKQLVIRMINKNYSSEEIVSLVPNYSQNDVDALRKELMDGNDTKP
ncbi:hypothetical protein AALC25_02175 [Lachnospiraceae bacterium 29-84]